MNIQSLFTIVTLLIKISLATPKSQRILDGKEADINEYPFVVQVLQDGSQVCSGSLISNRTVLTAAHCLLHPNKTAVETYRLQIRLGSSSRITNGTLYKVSTTVVHKNYDGTADNDLAVMVLTETVTVGKGISYASLPPRGHKIPDNSSVVLFGWGLIDAKENISSPTLMTMEVRTVYHNECHNQFTNKITVTDNMICTELLDVEGKYCYISDSGGPIIHDGLVIGVVSNKLCDSHQYPSVNVNVTKYVDWINATIEKYQMIELPFDIPLAIGVCLIVVLIFITMGIKYLFIVIYYRRNTSLQWDEYSKLQDSYV